MFIVPLRHKILNFASLMHRRRIHHCGAFGFLVLSMLGYLPGISTH